MMQYSSTQASKKGGQMLEHWGHLCETCEGAGAANLYFDRKSWMEHFNSHPEIYCTQLFYVAAKRNGYKLYDIILTKITKCCKLHVLCEIVKTVKIYEKLEQGQLYKLKTLGKRIKSFEI